MAEIQQITTDDLRRMDGQEGLILQPTVLGIKNPILAGLSYGGVLMLALPLAGCNSTTSSAPDAAGSSESASLPESSVQEGASEQERKRRTSTSSA